MAIKALPLICRICRQDLMKNKKYHTDRMEVARYLAICQADLAATYRSGIRVDAKTILKFQ
jgi:ribosomal protein L33